MKSTMHYSRIIFLLVTILTSISQHVIGQKVTVSPELLLRDDYSFALLGEVDNKILLVRNKGYSQSLSIYNDGLGFVQEIPLDFEDRKVNIIGFVTSKNDFNCYYSFRSGSKEYIKSVKMSSSGEKYFQDTVLVKDNVFLSDYYTFQGSENDRYIAIYNIIDDITLQLIFYDNQEMKRLYETKLVVQGVSMRKDLKGISVTNEGKLGMLFEKNNSSYKKESHHYRLINVDINGIVIDERIEFKGKYSISESVIANNVNNRFDIVGLYADKYENMCNGYFVYKGDSIISKPFPEEMLDQISLGLKKKIRGLEDYGMHDIIERKDGGYVLVMESNKEYYRASTGTRGFRNGGYKVGITDYYNEDIIVMSINPDASFQWNTVLPKKQFSQDDDGAYSSFFIFETPSLLRFVYNDEIKNNNTVSEYVLNPAGVYERNSVLSTAYQKLKLRIRSAVQISSTSYLMTSERNNRLNIVKIEYN